MQKLLTVLMLTLAMSATAQQNGDLMAQMLEMQHCLERVDKQQMLDLEQRGLALRDEVADLCANGQGADAQRKAMAFGRQIAESEVLKQVSLCTEQLVAMLPEMPLMDFEQDFSDLDVCDGSF